MRLLVRLRPPQSGPRRLEPALVQIRGPSVCSFAVPPRTAPEAGWKRVVGVRRQHPPLEDSEWRTVARVRTNPCRTQAVWQPPPVRLGRGPEAYPPLPEQAAPRQAPPPPASGTQRARSSVSRTPIPACVRWAATCCPSAGWEVRRPASEFRSAARLPGPAQPGSRRRPRQRGRAHLPRRYLRQAPSARVAVGDSAGLPLQAVPPRCPVRRPAHVFGRLPGPCRTLLLERPRTIRRTFALGLQHGRRPPQSPRPPRERDRRRTSRANRPRWLVEEPRSRRG